MGLTMVFTIKDKNHKTRIGTALFWGILSAVFMFGDYIPSQIVGALVIVIAVLSATKQINIGTLKQLDEAAFEKLNGQASRIKNEINSWAIENEIPFSYYGEHSILGYAFTDNVDRKINTIRDYWGNTNGNAMQIYALEMAVRGYYPVVRGQIALTLPMTDENITGFIETSKELITEIYK